jgi:hypothetical protein
LETVLGPSSRPYAREFAREYSKIRARLHDYKTEIDRLVKRAHKGPRGFVLFYESLLRLQDTLIRLADSIVFARQAALALTLLDTCVTRDWDELSE